jgi:diguanylate cyclase (GGDEF)-like protein/PAS domain S-box-containing protein
METDWSRERLDAFVRGKLIYTRDERGETAAAPDWLVACSDGIGPNDSSAAALEATHPEDRHLLITSFIEALADPGGVHHTRMRAFDDGRWVTIDIEWLNQIGNPDVGALVCTLDEVMGVEVEAPVGEEDDAGDHRAARWMIMGVTGIGRIESVRGKVVEILGYRPSQLRGRMISEFLVSDTLADGYVNWSSLLAEPGATSTSRRRWLRRDGTEIWLESSYLNQGSDTILAVLWDITERRAQEQELAELTRQFQMLADEVPAAVFRCDADGVVVFNNARWDELVADHPGVTRLDELVHPDDAGALAAVLADTSASPADERRSVDIRSLSGAAVWRVALRRAGATSLIGSIEDVTAAVRLQRQVRHDALTGLLNRQGLAERLDAALAEDPGGTVVVFLDLDGFKMVNDVHGHDAGDQVLAEIGRRLTAALRPGDAVGRYGGDEFVVVCRDAPGREQVLADRLEEALAGPVTFPGGQWEPAASVGAARPTAGEDLAAVLHRADLAMFAVKRRRKEERGLTARR